MLVVETIAKIRRDHVVGGKAIKAIARDRGVSRNTVRKVLRSKETEFRYERREPLNTRRDAPPARRTACGWRGRV